jgi:hypothetical protein
MSPLTFARRRYEQALHLLADPAQRFIGPAIVAACGRRAGS